MIAQNHLQSEIRKRIEVSRDRDRKPAGVMRPGDESAIRLAVVEFSAEFRIDPFTPAGIPRPLAVVRHSQPVRPGIPTQDPEILIDHLNHIGDFARLEADGLWIGMVRVRGFLGVPVLSGPDDPGPPVAMADPLPGFWRNAEIITVLTAAFMAGWIDGSKAMSILSRIVPEGTAGHRVDSADE